MKPAYIPILTILFVLFSKPIMAQEEPFKSFEKKNDVSLNVTSLLENILSLGSNEVTSLYNIVYRRKFENSAIRLGTSFNIANNNNFFGVNGGSETNLKNQVLNLKLGWEKHNPIAKNLMVHYGVDFIFGKGYSRSQVNFNFSNTSNSTTYGGGPVIRFEYKILPNLSVYTEGALYFRYGVSKNEFYDGTAYVTDKSNFYQLESFIPQVLYLAVHF